MAITTHLGTDISLQMQFVRNLSNESECFQINPDAAKRIGTLPNRSRQVAASPKVQTDLQNLRVFHNFLEESSKGLFKLHLHVALLQSLLLSRGPTAVAAKATVSTKAAAAKVAAMRIRGCGFDCGLSVAR